MNNENEKCPHCGELHSPAAIEIAEVVLDGKLALETGYGRKNICGLANLVDRKTGNASALALLAALQTAFSVLEKSVHFQSDLPFWRKGGDGYHAMLEARAAIEQAEGE